MNPFRKLRDAWRDTLQQVKQGVRAANRHRLYRRRMKKGVDYDTWIALNDTPTGADHASWQAWLNKQTQVPTISLLLDVPAQADAGQLQRSIDSVREQLVYPHWELLLTMPPAGQADAAERVARTAADADPRVRLIAFGNPGHGTAAQRAQAALLQSQGEWAGLLKAGDQLRAPALLLMAQAAVAHPDAALIYPDDDQITPQGRRTAHHFKPDWNPDFLLSTDYIGHACLICKTHLLSIGGYIGVAPGSETAFMFDTVLRCTAPLQAAQIVHVPRVLWHHPSAAASRHLPVDTASKAHALQQHLGRVVAGAKVSATAPGVLRVRYPVPTPAPLVSIVICTRNQYPLLRTCVQSITQKTSYSPYEIIIVDNGSDEDRTLHYLRQLPEQDARVRVIRDDSPFNYAALNNMAVDHARGELVALLNNDIEVISGDWLCEMVGHALRPDVGCVGAKLLYPDETVQHAGVLVGSGSDAPGAIAAHYQRGIPREAPGYARRAIAAHQLTAVTAACLVIRKATFLAVGGLDAKHLAVTYNDVDFCLRVGETGLRNVWTPHALLYHHESVSRGRDAASKNVARFLPELAYMQRRWADRLKRDPCYNPNLSHQKPDFLLAGQRETP